MGTRGPHYRRLHPAYAPDFDWRDQMTCACEAGRYVVGRNRECQGAATLAVTPSGTRRSALEAEGWHDVTPQVTRVSRGDNNEMEVQHKERTKSVHVWLGETKPNPPLVVRARRVRTQQVCL